MASVIPFFILLLAIYSYSAPIGQEYGISTTGYEYTTGQTIVEHVNSVTMNLISDNESTGVPTIQTPQSSEESNSIEVTTDYVTHSSHTYGKSPYSASTETYKKRNDYEYSGSSEKESNEKRSLEESSYPSSTETYKKRSNDETSDSSESESDEKRSLEESSYPSSTETYKKRSNVEYEDSSEKENNEKRSWEESSYPSSTGTYKKRGNVEYEDSSEKENNKKRSWEESSYPSSTETYKKRTDDKSEDSSEKENNKKRGWEESSYPSSTETYKKRTVEDFLYTTLESSIEFNQRAIRPVQSQEILESSTVYSTNPIKTTTNVKPSSSIDSFGKYTGLLNDKQSISSESQQTDQLSEESTTPLPIKTSQLTKTVSIVPGIVTQTKVYNNVPSKSSVFIQPVEQEQLSQGQSEPISKKRESDN
jgi:hypothetical protein